MKLLIEIPEEDVERCKKRFQMRIDIMGDAIANGTPVVIGTASWNYDNETCKYCGNNPKNGGSGVCHCTLATYKIT